ncbi:pyridoxal phosphate-dependent aminotransferase [Arthrobacter sp. zg-Y820]|uniref:pyridoxal phosphate-dependent aminotransferase n=1 Tax=unclassified Arthrobacter TaxID=235627 RepID=UPI001E42F661|nr:MULTISPECIES: pyridoxal phosphate-dependent aminotransferase [unclassified Arthrobacter]MCC9198162.1 pyridoxal phosphate-dependent aminotransferase [Arthrobacter sp. zg-Y820]MDK1281030.1 pyridoxal phosphate-dependent aminotransferase [Arthrobacter sp. zg.Y820]MDK1360346.1 pyridoxal phosphate-dependent aminotransferase [Arthrobacter sp. zg-Y1219]WIB10494.1 pyridoxal phosphate-dependent aminotransferase [Arthrobacter sp. zg-Y820]
MPELSPHVRNAAANQIREITQAAWAQPGSIVLSIGEPGFPTPPHILEAAQATLGRDETGYTPNAGIAPLRAAFADRISRQTGVEVAPGRAFVTAGAQQGLHLAMSMLLDAGDEILIPNPGYPTFAMTARLLHAEPVEYPLYPEHDFQPRIADIEALITDRTRVLLLNSPSNPLGAVFGPDLVRDLVELARRRDLWIVSDECYEAFTYDVPHVSPLAHDGADGGDRVIVSVTLSKTYGLTGLRIGALITPAGLETQMSTVMESIVSCVASPSQYAALAALTGPQDYVSAAAAHYRVNRDAAAAVLDQKNIPYLKAQGAFYLWADLSHATEGHVRAWTQKFLAEQGVAVAPGTAFGSIGEGWVRIALCGDTADLVTGLERFPERASGAAACR